MPDMFSRLMSMVGIAPAERTGFAATQASGDGVEVKSIESSSELAEYMTGGHATHAGIAVSTDRAMRIAAVYRCVNLLAGLMASLPIDIKEDETFVRLPKHTVARLFRRRPNKWQSAWEFKRLMAMSLLLRGNGYAYKVRSRVDGKVLSLIPMLPGNVKAEQLDDLSMRYTLTSRSGRQWQAAQDDVFHLRGMTLDGVTGLSVLSYARETLGISLAASEYQGKFFKNGTAPGAVLETDKALGKEGIENLRHSIAKFRMSDEDAFKTLVLEQGTKFQRLSMTAADAEFVEQKKLSVVEICMYFGIPPHVVGFTEKSTSWGSGIEQQNIGFVAYTLNDWFECWEGAIERDLLGDEEDLVADIDDADLMRGDAQTRWTAHGTAMQWGAASPNEIRRKERMPPREGGDIYYPPPNMTAETKGENQP